eukprot:81528_1
MSNIILFYVDLILMFIFIFPFNPPCNHIPDYNHFRNDQILMVLSESIQIKINRNIKHDQYMFKEVYISNETCCPMAHSLFEWIFVIILAQLRRDVYENGENITHYAFDQKNKELLLNKHA